jgi:flagellar FliL protein
MPTATATNEAVAAPPRYGRKKLLLIVGAAVLGLVLAGTGAVVYLKHRAAAAEAAAEAEDGADAPGVARKAERKDPKKAPTFMPLDPFTVNLADRDAERYVQVSITLELDEARTVDAIKAFMPVIRNNILLALSHKTANELLEREGKTRLAREIQRETARALGVEMPADEPRPAALAAAKGADGKPAARPKVPPPAEPPPVVAVHFSSFIIQ